MVDELHPYDGKTRRFRHDDGDPTEGRRLVGRLLRARSELDTSSLRYDLTFHSGGMGVADRICIQLDVDDVTRAAISRGLGAVAVPVALADPAWAEDLRWLVDAETGPEDEVLEAARRFVDEERAAFQSPLGDGAELWFAYGSNVNDWTAVWTRGATLNVLGFSQG